MLVYIERLGKRLLRCGVCRRRCLEVHDIRKQREWRDLSMRKLPLKLRYRPRRVECPGCGGRVDDCPWAEPWARVTTALSNAVAMLARELSWQGTAREYGLNWKSVATIVKRAVRYGLKHRKRPPVHVIGIDEVSRRKGQVYLTVVYDLERRVLLWVGEDRTEEAVAKFFTEERPGLVTKLLSADIATDDTIREWLIPVSSWVPFQAVRRSMSLTRLACRPAPS